VSFAAIRWALAQPVAKSSAKFVLVAMADCVPNVAAGAAWVCWPSYRYLAERTGLDFKTVEAGVFRLRESGYLVDTGNRRGSTGKVVVYQLNTPENGVIASGPEGEGEDYSQHANNPEIGVVTPGLNDPDFPANPPKFPAQSPQISSAMTPKTGSGTSKGTSKGTREKQVNGACARPLDVTEKTWIDWTALRTKKRTTVSDTVIEGAREQALLAGLSLEQFLKVWVFRGSQGLQAEWLKPHERGSLNGRPLNAQEALEASNRDVAARFLENDHGHH
jgi:hypothetical protein